MLRLSGVSPRPPGKRSPRKCPLVSSSALESGARNGAEPPRTRPSRVRIEVGFGTVQFKFRMHGMILHILGSRETVAKDCADCGLADCRSDLTISQLWTPIKPR
eukprot:7570938-Alexandrium_andersonii.AAC.1